MNVTGERILVGRGLQSGQTTMPIRETLTAKPVTLAEVLSNGKRYIVPPFQRDYAWDTSEWTDLWSDILAVHAARGP